MRIAEPALPFWHPATLISTWFGVGLLPAAPGSWGSLAALPAAWLILAFGSPRLLFLAALIAFLIGWGAARHYMLYAPGKDPKEVVIDEVSGQWLTLLFAEPFVWWHWLLGFLLFRLFDIAKPWPANLIDRRNGAFAVMADDMIAGVYAMAALVISIYAWGIIRAA